MLAKKTSVVTAVTISGTSSGSANRLPSATPSRREARSSPSAAGMAMSVASTVAEPAMMKEFSAASWMSPLAMTASNQRRLAPFHTVTRLPPLKE